MPKKITYKIEPREEGTRSLFLDNKFPEFFERILRDLEDTYLVAILLTRHDTPEEKEVKIKKFVERYGEFLTPAGIKHGLHVCGFYKRLRVQYPELHQIYSKFRAGRIELEIEDLRARQKKLSQQTHKEAAQEYLDIFETLSAKLKNAGADADSIARASEGVYRIHVNRQIQSMRNEAGILQHQAELNPELNSKIMVEDVKHKIAINSKQTEAEGMANIQNDIAMVEEEGCSDELREKLEELKAEHSNNSDGV